MGIKTYGTMAVDWERRIDFDRLRRERLARVKEMLLKSEMGAVLCFATLAGWFWPSHEPDPIRHHGPRGSELAPGEAA